jgi:hypothetical protein
MDLWSLSVSFRKTADMFVVVPKRQLAVFTDLTMPKRRWSELDQPATERKKLNYAKWRLDIARQRSVRQAAG